MQHLKKLIQLINQKGKKNIVLFEQLTIKPGKEQSLFQGVVNATFHNDHTASKYLYKSFPEDTRYVILKSRLEAKLLNYLLFLDLTESNQKQDDSTKRRCELLVHQAKLLSREREHQMSEKILRKAIRMAKEYEYTALQIEAQELLLHIYFTEEALTSYQTLKVQYNQQRQILAAERDGFLLYQQAHLRLLQDKTTEDTLEYIYSITQQLQQLWQQFQSFSLFDLYYRLHVRQLELEESYPQLLVLTAMAEEFVKELKVNDKRFNYLHNYRLRLYASLRAGELEAGLHLAEQGIPLFDPSSEDWLGFAESYFLLSLHSKRYQQASALSKQVEHSPIFTKAPVLSKEKWYLYKAFLHLMSVEQADGLPFDYATLRQKLPQSRKDKQGLNIALLLIEFCYLLLTHQKNALTKKAETYKKYLERHFTTPNLLRERIFFLLMLYVIRHNFRIETIEQKSAKLFNQLQQSLLPRGAHVSRIEIVPYPQLWEKIKEILRQKE